MMNGIWRAIIALFASLMMLGPILGSTSAMVNGIDGATAMNEPASNFDFTDKRVVVLSGQSTLDSYVNRLTKSTSQVEYSSNLSSHDVTSSTILMMDRTWFYNTARTNITENLEKIVLQGTPIINIGHHPLELQSILNSNRLSHSFPEDADVYGYYRNPVTGETISYAEIYEDKFDDKESMVIGQAYNWAVKRIEKMPVREVTKTTSTELLNGLNAHVDVSTNEYIGRAIPSNSVSGGDWGAAQWCDITRYNTQGYVHIMNAHFKLIDSSSTHDFWLSDFYVEERPKWSEGKYACADLDVKGQVSSPGQMIRHSPGTTSGTNTASVSLSFQYTADGGAGLGVSTGWSYSLPDVVITDNSQTPESKFYWWHDLNENNQVGKSTFYAEPGMITRVTQGDPLSIREGYGVNWCKQGLFGTWWDWDYKEYYHWSLYW
jgi:hypothetical protein